MSLTMNKLSKVADMQSKSYQKELDNILKDKMINIDIHDSNNW